MRVMKKSVFVLFSVWLLCWLAIGSVAAIDTPWLPVSPESGTTEEITEESSTPAESSAATSDNSDETDAPPPSTDGESVASTEQNQLVSVDMELTEQAVSSAEPSSSPAEEPGGCSCNVCGGGILVSVGAVAWNFFKVKRGAHREFGSEDRRCADDRN